MLKLDNVFRPKSLSSFFGQKEIIKQLKAYIFSAKNRKTVLDHILFYGPPGLGKTSLAYIISNEMKVNIVTITASTLEKSIDLISILGQLNAGDILFIDEIHRLKKELMEILYSAMEDFKIYVTYKNDENVKALTLSLPPFTLIGATTSAGNLSHPLLDRFSIIFKFRFYTDEELIEIIKELEKILILELDEESMLEIALRSRETPRNLINLLKRLYDYKIYKKIDNFDKKEILKAFKFLKINKYGLNDEDIEIIKVLKEKFNRPVSLEAIASILNEDSNNLKNINEPFLVNQGIIERTKQGRKLTKLGEDVYKQIINKTIL